MYCSKCGKYIDNDQYRYAEDGQILCVECAEGRQPDQPEFSVGGTPAAPKKNKKVGLIAGVVAAVAVVAAAIAIFLNLDAVENFWNSTFSTPENYMISVEDKALTQLVDSLATTPVVPITQANNGSSAVVKVTLSDEVLSLLETALATQDVDIDQSFLSDIRLKLDSNSVDNATSTLLTLLLGDQQILSVHSVVDDETFYLGFPEINSAYLSGAAEESGMIAVGSSLSSAASLPDRETVAAVLQRYIPTFLQALNDVTKNAETLELNGAKQNVTALTAKIGPEDLNALAIDLLNQLETDEEALALLQEVMAMANPYIEADGTDIKELLAEAKNAITEDSVDADSEGDCLLLTTYVNSVGDVVGRKLVGYADGIEVTDMSYITVTEDGTINRSLSIDGSVIFDGSGTETDGTFTIYADSEAALTLEYRDFVHNEDALAGTFVLTPRIGALSASTLMLGGTACMEVTLDNTADKTDTTVAICAGTNVLASVQITAEGTTVESIEVPADSIDMEDDEALYDYLTSIDFSAILENLAAANVPDALVEEVESLLYSLLYGF